MTNITKITNKKTWSIVEAKPWFLLNKNPTENWILQNMIHTYTEQFKNCLTKILPCLGVDTFTAAWWCENVWRGETSSLSVASQMFRRLSLPPLAKYLPSGDQANPQTSCEWLLSVEMWWLATLTSWWYMAPLLDPLKQSNLFPFNELIYHFFYIKSYKKLIFYNTVELVQSDTWDFRQKFMVPKYFC